MEIFLPNITEKVPEAKVRQMNPVVLAFVGDAVYTLYVRTKAALLADKKADALNKESAVAVSAVEQAKIVDAVYETLSEEEQAIFRRARNSKKNTRAKHASVSQYNKSTGFEAVAGYLYLTGRNDRLWALFGAVSGGKTSAAANVQPVVAGKESETSAGQPKALQ